MQRAEIESLRTEVERYSGSLEYNPIIYSEIAREVEVGFDLPSFQAEEFFREAFVEDTARAIYFSTQFLKVPIPSLGIGDGIVPDGKTYIAMTDVKDGKPFIYYDRDYLRDVLSGGRRLAGKDPTIIASHEMYHVWQWLHFPAEIEAALQATRGNNTAWTDSEIDKEAQIYSQLVQLHLFNEICEVVEAGKDSVLLRITRNSENGPRTHLVTLPYSATELSNLSPISY